MLRGHSALLAGGSIEDYLCRVFYNSIRIELNLNCEVEVGSALEKHNYFQIINQSASTNLDNLSLIDTRKVSNAFHQDFRK